jgi:hypothetical protein
MVGPDGVVGVAGGLVESAGAAGPRRVADGAFVMTSVAWLRRDGVACAGNHAARTRENATMLARRYPHARDDCDSCAQFDADIAVRHERLDGPDQRLCQRRAGPVLTRLVRTGHTITVRAFELTDEDGHVDGPGRPELASAVSTVEEVEPRHVEGVVWTVELAELVLWGALLSGSVFLRALLIKAARRPWRGSVS